MKKLFIFLLIVALITGCSQYTLSGTSSPTVYYTTANNELVPVKVSISSENVHDAANELFMKLYTSPQRKLSPVLFNAVKLIDLEIVNSECRIKLSENFLSLSTVSRSTIYGAVTKTLCSLPEIEAVTISCQDVTSTFTSDEFLTELPKAYYETQSLTLYYPRDDFFSAAKESATITVTPDTSLAKSAVQLLLNPPSDDLLSPFPNGCEVYDVYMEDNICVIDVSSEFVSHQLHDGTQETVILYSIVNTLTELPGIDKVKFLVEGKTSYGYTYHKISTPFRHSDVFFDFLNE